MPNGTAGQSLKEALWCLRLEATVEVLLLEGKGCPWVAKLWEHLLQKGHREGRYGLNLHQQAKEEDVELER